MTVLDFAPKSAMETLQKLAEGPAKEPGMAYDLLAPTIFHEPWWLDMVTGGDYQMAEVRDGGTVIGRLPYFPRRRLGLRYSIMPPMTHFLGPAVMEGEGHAPTRFLHRLEITHALIRQLPALSLIHYKCHGDVTDVIAFQQEQFLTGVQFTHEIAPKAEDVLWMNLRSKKRKKIRHARQLVTVEQVRDPLEFWNIYDSNLRARGMKNVCEKRLCCQLIEACLNRGRGRIYAARDHTQSIVAAVFCIWDAKSCFYFMSTRAPNADNAVSLLTWEAMVDAASRGLVFDFDGLNRAQSVLFFTEFGGVISPRYTVTRHTLAGGLAYAAKNWRRESRFFY